MANRDGLDWSDHHSFDPILNVRLGSRYLALMMEEFGDLEHALTAYNRGPSATHYILNHYDALPESVREGYSTPVIERYEKLRRTYGHLPAALVSSGGLEASRRTDRRLMARSRREGV
jgi:soluble lytic murein transglycosylase-like protein